MNQVVAAADRSLVIIPGGVAPLKRLQVVVIGGRDRAETWDGRPFVGRGLISRLVDWLIGRE